MSPGENFAGKVPPLRKVATFTPGEVVEQFHLSPPLQRDCVFSEEPSAYERT